MAEYTPITPKKPVGVRIRGIFTEGAEGQGGEGAAARGGRGAEEQGGEGAEEQASKVVGNVQPPYHPVTCYLNYRLLATDPWPLTPGP